MNNAGAAMCIHAVLFTDAVSVWAELMRVGLLQARRTPAKAGVQVRSRSLDIVSLCNLIHSNWTPAFAEVR